MVQAKYNILKYGEAFERIKPVAINEDFFAAILGGNGDWAHHVVFFEPEQIFYFYDCRNHHYWPTTEEKMKTLVSQYFIHCAQNMPSDVDIEPLITTFRSEETLKAIIKRARSMHAADASFFSVHSPYKRVKGPEVHDKLARLFIKEAIVPQPEAVLTISDCYTSFNDYCRVHGISPVELRLFKSMIAELISEELNVRVRHDIRRTPDKCERGWKGLANVYPGRLAEN